MACKKTCKAKYGMTTEQKSIKNGFVKALSVFTNRKGQPNHNASVALDNKVDFNQSVPFEMERWNYMADMMRWRDMIR